MENNYNNEDKNDILPIDLFNRFFRLGRRGLFDMNDIFGGFDDMHKEMDRMFNVFNDTSSNTPKELVREYKTSNGGKVREVGPIVYGFSMTIGPDGKPHVREFGNVKASKNNAGQHLGIQKPQVTAERESLYDITTTDREIKTVLEMPGLQEEDIKINAYDRKVEIKTSDQSPRKYYKLVDLPKEADIKTTRFTYNNDILEVTFDKKRNIKAIGKDVYVHLRNMFCKKLESKSKILKYPR